VTTCIKDVYASVSKPSGFLSLISTVFACSGSSRCRVKSRTVNRTWKRTSGLEPAVRLHCSDPAAPWPPDFKAQSAPFLSHTPINTRSLCETHRPSGVYGPCERLLGLRVGFSTDSRGNSHLQPAVISYLCVNKSNSPAWWWRTFLQTSIEQVWEKTCILQSRQMCLKKETRQTRVNKQVRMFNTFYSGRFGTHSIWCGTIRGRKNKRYTNEACLFQKVNIASFFEKLLKLRAQVRVNEPVWRESGIKMFT